MEHFLLKHCQRHKISVMTEMLIGGLNQWTKGLTQWDGENEADQFITVLHDNEKEIDKFLNLFTPDTLFRKQILLILIPKGFY